MLFYLLVCSAAVGVQVAQAADDYWMKYPYGNNDFNYQFEFNDNFTMECNDTFLPDGYTMMYWIRPDLTVMMPGDENYFRTLDGDAGWMVNATSGDMEIVILQESQFGFYHCVLNDSTGSIYVVKKGLNYEEAYFGSLWDDYMWNTIIGLSAAGGFALICICAMLICKFQFNPDKDDDHSSLGDVSYKDLVEGGSGGSVKKDAEKLEFDNIAFVVGETGEKGIIVVEDNTSF